MDSARLTGRAAATARPASSEPCRRNARKGSGAGEPTPPGVRPAPPGSERGLRGGIGVRVPALKGAWTKIRQRSSGLLVPVEAARGLLLEPQSVVLRRLLEELGRLLEHVLALGRLGSRGARGGPLRLGPGGSAPGPARAPAPDRRGPRPATGPPPCRARARRPPARRGSPGISGGSSISGTSATSVTCSSGSTGSGASCGSAGASSPASPAGFANSPRTGAPSASRSWRETSSGSAPWRRLSSRCSRMASSSSPMPRLERLLGPDRTVLPGPLGAVQGGVRRGDQRVLAVP